MISKHIENGLCIRRKIHSTEESFSHPSISPCLSRKSEDGVLAMLSPE